MRFLKVQIITLCLGVRVYATVLFQDLLLAGCGIDDQSTNTLFSCKLYRIYRNRKMVVVFCVFVWGLVFLVCWLCIVFFISLRRYRCQKDRLEWSPDLFPNCVYELLSNFRSEAPIIFRFLEPDSQVLFS